MGGRATEKGRFTVKAIKELDRSDMLQLLLDFPQQCLQAAGLAQAARIETARRDFSKVLCAGLGGSAIGADVVRTYLYHESALVISVCREYDLPAWVDATTLVFISSYSGNTEETLSAYAQARSRGATIIAISSGGRLKEYALRDRVTFVEIPGGLPPRCALGYLSIIPLVLLERLGLAKDALLAVTRMARVLEGLRDKCLSPRIGIRDNVSRHIAKRLRGKLAVIYASSIHFDAVATRWRGQLNENAKYLASSHVFPEMNHNEITGWQNPKKLFRQCVVVLLRSRYMHQRVSRRMDITRDIIRKEGAEVLEVWARGEDLLSDIYSLIYIGDFVSFYLAILGNTDPTPVERVTFLKNELAKEA